MASLFQIINLDNVRKVFRNISKVGFVVTLRYVVSDLLFDFKYKVDTINTAMLRDLKIDSPNKEHATYYEGTNTYVFRKIFSLFEIDAPNGCFVDFGSGKGKALFMAAELGFRKVIGVEFSIELVEICRKNLEIFKRKSKTKTEFEIIHLDASDYVIPPEANLFYFANPFNETVAAKVVGNVIKSLDQSPREAWAVQLYPQGNMALINHPRFHLEHEWMEGLVFRLTPGA